MNNDLFSHIPVLEDDTEQLLEECECNGMTIPDFDAQSPSQAELDDAQAWLDGEDVPNMLLRDTKKWVK